MTQAWPEDVSLTVWKIDIVGKSDASTKQRFVPLITSNFTMDVLSLSATILTWTDGDLRPVDERHRRAER
jgi:hypothetical protein